MGHGEGEEGQAEQLLIKKIKYNRKLFLKQDYMFRMIKKGPTLALTRRCVKHSETDDSEGDEKAQTAGYLYII